MSIDDTPEQEMAARMAPTHYVWPFVPPDEPVQVAVKRTPEQEEQIKMYKALYGNAFELIRGDGTVEILDPRFVIHHIR